MASENLPFSDGDWLTVKEIAEELRLTPATVRTWISAGNLRAKRAGKRKWLVQRGEVNRMLAGEDRYRSDDPYIEGKWYRPAESVLPPGHSPDWPPAGMPERFQDMSPTDVLQLRTRFWWDYLEESEHPPPDPEIVLRMESIAESMASKAAAIANLDGQDPGKLWHLQNGLPNGVLSRELSPSANRPGSAALWTTFDASVAALDQAMRDHDLEAERAALDAVSIAMYDVIEELGEIGYPWPQITSFKRGSLSPDGRGMDRPILPDGRPLKPARPPRVDPDGPNGD